MKTTTIVAIDFGAGNKLRIHGPDGPILVKDLNFPRVKNGKTAEDDFLRPLKNFLEKDYTVVTESPSVGSCGVEPKKVRDLMLNYRPDQFKLISARAVKNYLQDNNIEKDKKNADAQSAAILYQIATTEPWRLKVWRYEEAEAKYQRKYRSTRPMGQRKYRDERAIELLKSVPAAMPQDVEKYLKTPADKMPFIMALQEPLSENRDGYQKVIGLYEHGYPSFYRRATVKLMHDVAKDLAGVTKMKEVDKTTRKQAWKQTQKLLRKFYAICKAQKLDTEHSAKDTIDSVSALAT